MNERRDPVDIVRQNKWLRFFWIGLTLLFAVLIILAIVEFNRGESALNHVLIPATLFVIGLINALLIKGVLRAFLLALAFIFLVWSFAIMLLR